MGNKLQKKNPFRKNKNETYIQGPKKELFTKIVNECKSLTLFAKTYILNVFRTLDTALKKRLDDKKIFSKYFPYLMLLLLFP